MSGYQPVFFDQAAEFVLALPRQRQRRAMDRATTLAQHPFVPGDFVTTDAGGHRVEHLLVDEFVFSYWIDHAARLVMITEIESAE